MILLSIIICMESVPKNEIKRNEWKHQKEFKRIDELSQRVNSPSTALCDKDTALEIYGNAVRECHNNHSGINLLKSIIKHTQAATSILISHHESTAINREAKANKMEIHLATINFFEITKWNQYSTHEFQSNAEVQQEYYVKSPSIWSTWSNRQNQNQNIKQHNNSTDYLTNEKRTKSLILICTFINCKSAGKKYLMCGDTIHPMSQQMLQASKNET